MSHPISRAVEIKIYPTAGDARGDSYPLGDLIATAISKAVDCHVATMNPGAIRGNHAHLSRCELIMAIYRDRWSLFWDGGPGTSVHEKKFDGAGLAALTIPPGCSHALRNDGLQTMTIVSISDGKYSEQSGETIRRHVCPPQ